jgi:hypothetical protein
VLVHRVHVHADRCQVRMPRHRDAVDDHLRKRALLTSSARHHVPSVFEPPNVHRKRQIGVPSVARPHRRSGRSIAAGGAAHLTRKVGLCAEGCKDTTTWGGSLRTDGVRCAPLEGRSTGKDKEGGEHCCVLRETRMAGEERYGVINLPTCICVRAAWSDGRRRADGRKRETQGNLI